MRRLVILLVAIAGSFVAFGCALAILFELQGFGTPRDEGPRVLYLSALGLGFVLSLFAPVLAWLWLVKRAPAFALAASGLAFALAFVLLLFGLSWAG